jgi:hypothetical protein
MIGVALRGHVPVARPIEAISSHFEHAITGRENGARARHFQVSIFNDQWKLLLPVFGHAPKPAT